MLLASLLRTTVALALTAPPGPTTSPAGSPATSPAGSPVTPAREPASRTYAGAELAEPSSAASDPEPTAAPADSPAPAIVPAPAATTPPKDAAPLGSAAPLAEGPVEDDEELLPYDPLVDSPEAIRARHLVRSGIVFVVVGGVLTIGAIAMSQAAVNNPETGSMPCSARGDPAGNGCTEGGRTRATAALAVPGALLLAGGAAMLAVGKVQQKRLRASLHADRRGFQIGLTLRF